MKKTIFSRVTPTSAPLTNGRFNIGLKRRESPLHFFVKIASLFTLSVGYYSSVSAQPSDEKSITCTTTRSDMTTDTFVVTWRDDNKNRIQIGGNIHETGYTGESVKRDGKRYYDNVIISDGTLQYYQNTRDDKGFDIVDAGDELYVDRHTGVGRYGKSRRMVTCVPGKSKTKF